MGDHSASLSTQETNPRQAVARTILAAIVALVPILNGALAIVATALEPHQVSLPSWVFPALNGAIAVTALAMGIVTKIMAMPGVNEWLRKYAPMFAPTGK